MSDLVVVAFDDDTTAFKVRDTMARMQKEHLVALEDAAIAVRRQDGKVKIHQAVSLVGGGAFGGAFWGFLIGLIFFVPFFGAAIGAAAGALTGKFSDIGVDDKFIKQVGETLQPGNSAIFLLFRDATYDKVLEELEPFRGTVVKTSLSNDQEAKLKEAFAHDQA